MCNSKAEVSKQSINHCVDSVFKISLVYKTQPCRGSPKNLSTYNDLNTAQKVGNYKLFKTVPSNQAISTGKKEIEVKVYKNP